MYSWDAAITRYYNQKLGVTVDGRGYYGTAYMGLNEASLTRPAISQYGVLAGPTYRFILRPQILRCGACAGRRGDRQLLGRHEWLRSAEPRALSGCNNLCGQGGDFRGVQREPGPLVAAGPDYYVTGFGSTMQNSIGFTYGLVYRFGKQ